MSRLWAIGAQTGFTEKNFLGRSADQYRRHQPFYCPRSSSYIGAISTKSPRISALRQMPEPRSQINRILGTQPEASGSRVESHKSMFSLTAFLTCPHIPPHRAGRAGAEVTNLCSTHGQLSASWTSVGRLLLKLLLKCCHSRFQSCDPHCAAPNKPQCLFAQAKNSRCDGPFREGHHV